MIYIGLTGWGDHPILYSELSTSRDKLFDYSGHFPVVEVLFKGMEGSLVHKFDFKAFIRCFGKPHYHKDNLLH